MFDYHLHSAVSVDSVCAAKKMVRAAERTGLKEICFTDHYDFNDDPQKHHDLFALEDYRAAYETLASEKTAIRRGVEFGLTLWNPPRLKALLGEYPFDFVIGSVHFVGGFDPYYPEFWEQNAGQDSFEKYLLQTLECVKVHDDYDVLGHINYVCKSIYNPTRKPLRYRDYRDLCDEIMKRLAEKGRGMEVNTSGMDRVGEFLPSGDYLKRFKELGGQIITVGSDAHDDTRIGQYIPQAMEMVKDIFGYVCTFEKRKAVFHRL